jgi:trimeric autotransporter adhesin
VTDSLTGTIFSVNDISGIPVIEAIAGTTNVVEVTGEIRASGEITAFFSDERLKTKVGNIDNPVDIVKSLSAFKYVNNQKANDFGYHDTKVQVGLSAQQVQSVLPEIVSLAPFDTIKDEDGNKVSRTGEDYLTLDYAKLVPVLIEAIKDQQNQIDELKQLLGKE